MFNLLILLCIHQISHLFQLEPHLLVIFQNRQVQKSLPGIKPVVVAADLVRVDQSDLIIKTHRFAGYVT